MVLNAAVQMLREAEELKQKILKFKSGTSMLQDKSLWATQQQLQKVYQKVLELDLDYALEKKVEQDLWNVGFKQQIEALQAISKDRKNALRSEAQAMLSWVLQAAAGFYLCLLHQICTTFKLDLPFRRRASLLGAVEGWEAAAGAGAGAGPAGAAAARYASQHCLVHLGDLARYRQQLRLAHTFYRHALAVSVHSGQPYNQLALVSWRRGRRLAAVYWHVRSLLVRAPFPPAPANLARTLAAAAGRDAREAPLPVLPGLAAGRAAAPAPRELPDAHAYVNELVRAAHYLHSLEQLDTAEELVTTLSASLAPLLAADSFDSMTLVKMACVLIWLVQSSTEEFSAAGALSAAEARAARLAGALAEAALRALLAAPPRALPAAKVLLQWAAARRAAGAAWGGALWAALARACGRLAPAAQRDDTYDTVPLPEDEELNGFLPLEEGFKDLKFNDYSNWDSTKVPDADPNDEDSGSWASSPFVCEPEREHAARARRLLRLAARLAQLHPEHLQIHTAEDGSPLVSAAGAAPQPARPRSPPAPPPPPPPLVISEADFREKVREKRVGILKPQGSLERAREERALATAQDEPITEAESCDDSNKSEDKKEGRKVRVNIAMAAIMRKQEETNKQVKFITPPPTPDSIGETSDNTSKEDKPKMIQPKPIKSLANLPIGRKTGGILSLKDKSAGYPHLQNPDPEPKKSEKEDKKDNNKPNQSNTPSSQNFQPKREQATNWPNQSAQNYNEGPRISIQKNYGIQNTGISYNPNYQAPVNNQGIRLPVVNPKEIDVRTAALQKQSSRQELFQDGHKFGNQGYQMSGDKKNFLNDLPPRFANQYRYWQNAQENQYNDNKFRDDSPKNTTQLNAQGSRQNWPTPQNENFQQPMSWWKPENQPNFNPQNFSTPPINVPNFYSPLPTNMSNPYINMPFNQMQGQNLNQNVPNVGQNLGQNVQNKPETLSPSFVQPAIGQPQIQTLQNLVTSPNFNSTLNNFGPFNAPVSYDSSMYPQFNKLGYQPLQVNMMDKQNFQGQASKESDVGLNFGNNALNLQQRNHSYNETYGNEGAAMKNLDDVAGAGEASTYSLFSGAPDAAWQPRRAQSLWAGAGSPLARLLEQQRGRPPLGPRPTPPTAHDDVF